MGINVIVGDDSAMSVLAFGLPNQNTINHLQSQYYNLDKSLFRDTSFIDRSFEQFNALSSIEALNRSRAILESSNVIYDVNSIRELKTILDFQTASPVMQRYIMANPMVREYYHQDRCDGYFGMYVDTEPKFVKDEHTDYRRVNDGYLDFDIPEDEEEDVIAYVKVYTDIGDDEPLAASEKINIKNTWRRVEDYFVMQGEDPTDIFGCNL